MPVYQQTKDANFAIQIAPVWCFVEALIPAGGSFPGETIRKMIPRTVLLSCLSGFGTVAAGDEPDAAGIRSADRLLHRPVADLH